MEKRIYYYDTDSGGVVYYANYLKYLEEARTEFLEKKGLSVKIFQENGLLYAVRQCNVTYRSPARYGDILECTASLKKKTAVQLIFDQTVLHKDTGRLLIEAEVTLVCLNQSFRPEPMPEHLRNLL